MQLLWLAAEQLTLNSQDEWLYIFLWTDSSLFTAIR